MAHKAPQSPCKFLSDRALGLFFILISLLGMGMGEGVGNCDHLTCLVQKTDSGIMTVNYCNQEVMLITTVLRTSCLY